MSYPVTSAGTEPAPYPRHALGLPAGSVRALLGLGVLGLLWALAFEPAKEHKLPLDYLYLQFLMVLVLGHYFAAHGHSIGKNVSASSPLGLPGGTVRFLLLVGYMGLVYYLIKERHDLTFETPPQANLIVFLALILSGFFVGHILTWLVRVLSGGTLPFWFQDIQAWVAILALLGLGALMIIHVFINPHVRPDLKIGVHLDVLLGTLVSFYFGARS